MGSMSVWHWVIVAVVVMLLFGRGKVSELMGDVAKGIKAFKKGMADDETQPNTATSVPPVSPNDPVRTLPHQGAPGTAPQPPHVQPHVQPHVPAGDHKAV
ncbi:twin-arginine translocase TatA/TatE family subunit [Methylobacterium sp. AMS5]|uniref:twin-arginine translocase TatA/TatE family subunit n=1 Tax=Methylobacterium sp. AMS5 TaxID=925818 RepID=UPI00074F9344|nr:twin-arginine translocase TatA/TatE family subunit [Methylobacterium sp. AMS5]AMB46570.1 preprotein translocase subunit TatA [Methylobacterium sp. AMS5]